MRRTAALLVLAALLAVPGCTSSGASAGPSATERPPAGALPNPIPPQADPQAVEGAVRDYYEAVAAAANTGVTTTLAAASVASCPCRSVVDYVDGVYAAGGRLERFGYSVTEVADVTITGSRATAVVTYSQAPYQQVDAQGEVTATNEAEPPASKLVTLDLVDGRWLVAGIEPVAG